MDKREKLLNELNMCARIALTSYKEFKGHVGNPELKEELDRERNFYERLLEESKKLLRDDIPKNSMSCFQKMGMRMKLFFNDDDCTVADMLLEGTLMGFVNVNKALNRLGKTEDEVVTLARETLEEFKTSFNNLARFL